MQINAFWKMTWAFQENPGEGLWYNDKIKSEIWHGLWNRPWRYRFFDASVLFLSLGVEMYWQWRRMAMRMSVQKGWAFEFLCSWCLYYLLSVAGGSCMLFYFPVRFDQPWKLGKLSFSLIAGLRGTISWAEGGGTVCFFTTWNNWRSAK